MASIKPLGVSKKHKLHLRVLLNLIWLATSILSMVLEATAFRAASTTITFSNFEPGAKDSRTPILAATNRIFFRILQRIRIQHWPKGLRVEKCHSCSELS
jgi:hypothetical protein